MRVCIYGAGAIGGHLAARYASGGAEVSVIARGPQLAAIRANGLILQTKQGDIHCRPRAAADPGELGQQDAVIVTVKATAIPDMIGRLQPLLAQGTPVVFALNGIPWWYMDELRGTKGAIARAIDPSRVVGCVIFSANTVVAPGVVHADGSANRFVMGELDGTLTDRLAALTDPIARGGAKGEPTADIRGVIWRKLLTNVMTGSVACLTGANGRQLAADPALARICIALGHEANAVAASLGIDPGFDPARFRPENYTDHKSSILQDLELGRKMEIDGIAGAVQEAGALRNVPTPTLDIVLALVRSRASLLGLYA